MDPFALATPDSSEIVLIYGEDVPTRAVAIQHHHNH